MHVDWNWIRQRPHWLAGALARRHQVSVLYRLNPHRSQLRRNPRPGLCLPLPPIPERIFGSISHQAQKVHIAAFWAAWRPDVAWLTFPDLLPLLPRRKLASMALVYDCMDLAEGFFSAGARRERVRGWERELLRRADLVLCSSQSLHDGLAALRPGGELLLARNALPLAEVPSGGPPPPPPFLGRLDLGYFGTVSHWMDWPLVRSLLDSAPDVHLHMVGPVEQGAGFTHPRLHLLGPAPREGLLARMAQCHACVLPFRDTPLVRGVDPVKLNEYLACGRPVLCLRYPEIERFAPFVTFYRTADDCVAFLERLRRGDPALCAPWRHVAEFLAANTWERRVEDIEPALLRARARARARQAAGAAF